MYGGGGCRVVVLNGVDQFRYARKAHASAGRRTAASHVRAEANDRQVVHSTLAAHGLRRGLSCVLLDRVTRMQEVKPSLGAQDTSRGHPRGLAPQTEA